MKSQKPTPPRNARASSSSPTSIPAPVDNNNPTSPDETKDKQDEEKLEDVLKEWSSTPSRQSLPFLSDLHKVGRLYDAIVRSRSHSREEQFGAMDETRSHLDNVLRSTDSKQGKGVVDSNMPESDDDKRTKAAAVAAEAASTPGPKQQQAPLAKFFDRQSLKHLKVKTQDLPPSTPVPLRKRAVFPTSEGPTAPGSKVSDITPWRRASPPTPTPSRKLVEVVLPDTPESALGDGSSPASPLRFSKPIPIRTKQRPEQGLRQMLDLPLPAMKGVLPEVEEGGEGDKHLQLKPVYTQSYVNGVVEAMKHAHATIAKMSQQKREVEGRLGVLEEKQRMWHALVHGQGCGCGEARWWREVEEVLIEKRGVFGFETGNGGSKGEDGEEGSEGGRFGMDGACDEEEDAWDVILGSSVGGPEI